MTKLNKILGMTAAIMLMMGSFAFSATAAHHENPCNPCAMKHANPCDMKDMHKKHANPCNPCDMKKMHKKYANPCNPCDMKHGH